MVNTYNTQFEEHKLTKQTPKSVHASQK